MLQDGVLTMRGEKKSERKDERENYHLVERSYGSFQRSIRLPETIDEDKVEARFDKGVLTVTLPKRPEMVKAEKKIAIKQQLKCVRGTSRGGHRPPRRPELELNSSPHFRLRSQ